MVEPITKSAAGLDVHKMMVMATVILEQEDGSLFQQTREFNTLKKGRRAMCQWLQEHAKAAYFQAVDGGVSEGGQRRVNLSGGRSG